MSPDPSSRFDPDDPDDPEITAPQWTVSAGPGSAAERQQAARAVDRVIHLRTVLLLAAAVVLLVVAVLLAHHARRFDNFMVVVNGTTPTAVPVPHYSPAWIGAATAAAIIGAVLGTLGVVELIRTRWAAVVHDREHTTGLGH